MYRITFLVEGGFELFLEFPPSAWDASSAVYVTHQLGKRLCSKLRGVSITKDGEEYPIIPLWLLKAIKDYHAKS